MNQFSLDSATQSYFKSLPISVQESIKQSGVTFRTETELRSFAEQLLIRPEPSAE